MLLWHDSANFSNFACHLTSVCTKEPKVFTHSGYDQILFKSLLNVSVTKAIESPRVAPSRTESHRVAPSRTESHRVTESHQVTESHHLTESHRVAHSHTESHRVSPSHTESHQVTASHTKSQSHKSQQDTNYHISVNNNKEKC